MSVYDELIEVADRMEEFAISIEINKDPSIIRNLKREKLHLLKIADDIKKMQMRSKTVQRNAMYLQRILFYELIRQNDTLFLDRVKPIVGDEDFEWKVKHQMFTNQEISSAMTAVLEEEEIEY